MADSICHECRGIDFGKVLEFPATEWSSVGLDADVNRLAEASGNNCPLCQLMASTLLACEDEWSDPGIMEECATLPYRLSAFSFLQNCPWASKDLEGAKDCHILLAPRGVQSCDLSRWARHAEDGYIACLPKEREAGLFVPQLVSDTFDYKKAKLWLWNCRTTHGTACNEYREEIPGLKAIDCETLRIVQIQPGALWVALSYVWGHDQRNVSPDGAKHGTIPCAVSKTIQHAIEVTKGLGYKYLWVDRYCINQEDEDEKHGLIAKMDMIYHGADLTIVAATGHDEDFGLPGIGTTQRKKQKVIELDSCIILSTGPDPILETGRSRWWTRGWTFQEAVFSRRRLIFTEHQSYFECDQASWMEALGGLELLNDKDSDEPQSSSGRIGRNLIAWCLSDSNNPEPDGSEDERKVITRIEQFSTMVQYYSERNLTFDTDSLNAFAGISRYFQNSTPPLVHILGIPFMSSSMSTDGHGSTEKLLFYFLCWVHYRHSTSTPRRRQNFPSWTWAGWAGRVGWMAATPLTFGRYYLEQKMRFIRFEVDGHLIPQEEYLSIFDPVRCSSTDSDVVLCFQARVVPSSMFSWSTYVDIDEENYGSNKGLTTGTNDYTEEEDSDAQSQQASRVQPPDPNDWSTWTVGKLRLWDASLPPDCDPGAFMEHIQEGRWDCLLLGDYEGNGGFCCRRFLLIIEWLDNGLARRVGCLVVNKHPYLDWDSKFFNDSWLSWKAVRVI